ncbi:MAG TPA: amidohydrolase [Gemmatimonadales bacterium]|nr:amidohydrolase [Gemmatimonadales bacterium]
MGRPVADLVLTLALGACWGGGAPDQILVNGKIFTADPARLWVGGIAIRGDRIVAVGASDSLRGLAGPRTQLRDLGARMVIPGINDAHAHVGPVPRAVTVATTPDAGLREVVDSLARVSRRRPRGTWLITTIGDRVLDDPRANRFFLDSVVPDHPAVLESWSGHEAILNSAALGALGLGHETRDPLGGHFGRAGGSGPGAGAGALDGRLSEYAWWNTRRRLSSGVGDSAARADLRDYAAQAARFGITSVQDMNTALSATRAVFLLHGVDGPIRWRVIRFPLTGPDGRALADLRERRARPGGELDVSGTKYILDGTPVERGALMRHAYADRPGWRGELNLPRDTLRAIVTEALGSRDQLLVHAVGDSAIRLLLSVMTAAAPDSTWRTLRPRLEHGDFLTPDLVPLARRLGAIVVQNPAHFAVPALLRRRYPAELAAHVQPLRSLLAAGIPIALGSDGPMNPYLNIMLAVTHPADPSEALTREQAVTAYTRGSAYAEFAERDLGTLTPGMLADLTVLSQDIFDVPVSALPQTVSVLTLVGGRAVYDAGVVK